MRDELLKQARRVVVKIGSSLVASRAQGLSADRIERLAGEVAAVRGQGREIVLVSSGAVVSGIKKLGLREYPKSLPVKQAAAAVGQSQLMWAYEKAFEPLDLRVAQVLLTHADLADRRRFLNARHTLTTLIGFGVIPVINENDTVAVEEIRVGDNDTLAAQVAHLIDADLLVILSDVEGLFTVDPRKDPTATLIPVIPEINEDIERRAGISSTFEGTGGMATKIRAAKKVGEYGVATLILNGTVPGLLPDALTGKEAGSLFLAKGRRLNSRKHWIAFTLRARGQLKLDQGAVDALTQKGKAYSPRVSWT
ncbi:MAG: glutamate 5-kinase [Nitrospiraceae bacterium]